MATCNIIFARCLWRVGMVLFFLLYAGSGPAGAHSVVVESSPKDKEVLTHAPKEVMLRFNARIEKSLTRISLVTSEGRKIPLPVPPGNYGGDSPDRVIIPLPHLVLGNYLLHYKVLSTDGHATSGVLRFSIVGAP